MYAGGKGEIMSKRSEGIGTCGCKLERDENGLHMVDCPMHAAAPDLLWALTRLTEKTERANRIQHSGGTVAPEDWSELYTMANEARTAIAKATGQAPA